MGKESDRLINTGRSNVYFLLFTLLVTLTGFLYILGILPAYDPAILAQPVWLTYTEYAGLALGGSLAFLSFILPDRLHSLRLQFVGLFIQALAALVTLLTVSAFGGLQGLFIIIFGLLIVTMHGTRLIMLSTEVKTVPEKRMLADSVSGDDLLQIVLVLLERNEQLEKRLEK